MPFLDLLQSHLMFEMCWRSILKTVQPLLHNCSKISSDVFFDSSYILTQAVILGQKWSHFQDTTIFACKCFLIPFCCTIYHFQYRLKVGKWESITCWRIFTSIVKLNVNYCQFHYPSETSQFLKSSSQCLFITVSRASSFNYLCTKKASITTLNCFVAFA